MDQVKNTNLEAMADLTEVVGISQDNQRIIDQHEEMRQNYELRQKADKYPVPTNDLLVKARLRQLGQPIQLFGEDKGMRRDRLHQAIIEHFLTFRHSPDEDVFCYKLVDFSNLGGTAE